MILWAPSDPHHDQQNHKSLYLCGSQVAVPDHKKNKTKRTTERSEKCLIDKASVNTPIDGHMTISAIPSFLSAFALPLCFTTYARVYFLIRQ